MRRSGRQGEAFDRLLAVLVEACETGLDLAGVLSAACAAAAVAAGGPVSAYTAAPGGAAFARIAGAGGETLELDPDGRPRVPAGAFTVPMINARRTLGHLVYPGGGDRQRLALVAGIAAQAIEVSRLWERDARGADPLTGLAGHGEFHERLAGELARARRSGERVAAVLFDLDRLALLNESSGTAAGDAALRTAARCLEQGVRPYDAVCRVGGDEFGLVLPGIGAADAGRLTARLREALAGSPGGTAASAGVAAFPGHATSPGDLVRRASGALYWAKRDGGGRVVVYDPDLVEALTPREHAARLERETYSRTVRVLEATHGPSAAARATSEWAGHLGAQMGLPPERVDRLRLAAFLYDAAAPPAGAGRERLAAQVAANALDAEAAEWLVAAPAGLDAPIEARVIAVAAAFVGSSGHTSPAHAGRALADLWARSETAVDAVCVRALEALLSDRVAASAPAGPGSDPFTAF